MDVLENGIIKGYEFLYNRGYKNVSPIDNGNFFTSFNCISDDSILIFNFTIEKGILSVALTTEFILTSKAVNKFNKMLELLYIIKLLNPDLDFSEIKKINFANEVKQKFSEIEFLFCEENVFNTIKEINKLEKEYSKLRFG